MIGVLCFEHERAIVQEFFELFKTPWEFFDARNKYEVIVSTRPDVPETDTRLIVLYSSTTTQLDREHAIRVNLSDSDHVNCDLETFVPIYRKLSYFESDLSPLAHTEDVLEVVAVDLYKHQNRIVRVGFDLFDEIAYLLKEGQPLRNASSPTLDLHISMLREWIVATGIPLIEIPPLPHKYKFFACLTHDIDFVGIRGHYFDSTLWGFAYRGSLGSLFAFLKSNLSFAKLLVNWMAVLKLPLVLAGMAADYWVHFEKYTKFDNGHGSTFFLIPFKNNAGDGMGREDHSKRATRYDVDDVKDQARLLNALGYEVGLHGINAWNSSEKGRRELERVIAVTGQKRIGVRMHWLYYSSDSPLLLDKAGFDYDATLGYNETIGFKNGTLQVFQPSGVNQLLELPLNIQDTSLFYPRRLNLNDTDATRLCNRLVDFACRYGGVLTLSWHGRSLEPERLWGDFYNWLLVEIRKQGAWIGSAQQIVEWFRLRRSVAFGELRLKDNKFEIALTGEALDTLPQLIVRLYIPDQITGSSSSKTPSMYVDIPWRGEHSLEIAF